ncbi:MAG: ABC transporter ATP-binding protein, partial [Thermomicrobiales bacterium]
MSKRDIVIDVRGLTKAFEGGRINALNGVDLQIERGEWVAIVGPSGCGKSTLLHLIASLDHPDDGKIVVDDHDLAKLRDFNHFRSHHVGMIFQLHNLLPSLTASENVQAPMFELRISARERRKRAEQRLVEVGLVGKEKQRPALLSGGERQRIAIARALANDPPILLADEPTGNLDSQAGRLVLDLLERIRLERDLTIVMVTHDPSVAARADRLVEMLDGRIISQSAPEPERRLRDGRGCRELSGLTKVLVQAEDDGVHG